MTYAPNNRPRGRNAERMSGGMMAALAVGALIIIGVIYYAVS